MEKVAQLDADQKFIYQFVRDVGGDHMKVLSEIYSPPRVTAAAKSLPEYGIDPGVAMDLKNGWDFDRRDHRELARRRFEETKPGILIGTTMCTAFSSWQAVNHAKRDPDVVHREWVRAMVHLRFLCELYKEQYAQGRYFLHEHPTQATSWNQPCIKEILELPHVERVDGDRCQYGQKDPESGDPVKKPTGWMSNAPRVLEALSDRCRGSGGQCSRREGGRHRVAEGKLTATTAIFPFKLCKAILKGYRRQLIEDGRLTLGVVGIQQPETELTDRQIEQRCCRLLNLEVEHQVLLSEGEPQFKDAITGQVLRPDLVREARRREMEYFLKKNVWQKRPREESMRVQGKPPISCKWVDVNKGDDAAPNYRSRLVAREVRRPWEEAIFAPTPPLESIRSVLSLAATDVYGDKPHVRDPLSEQRTQVSILDISRAYFNAVMEGEGATYVELPHEDPDRAKGLCGLLNVHLYGTRAAAQGWHGC